MVGGDVLACGVAERAPEVGVVEHAADAAGQRVDVAGRVEQAGAVGLMVLPVERMLA